MSDDTTAATRRTPVQVESRAQYEALVADHPLVLLEFTTPGCGICASMEPVLGVVARAGPGLVAVASAPDVPGLVRAFDVRKAPTLVVLRDGAEVDRLDEGFQSADRLVEVLEAHAG